MQHVKSLAFVVGLAVTGIGFSALGAQATVITTGCAASDSCTLQELFDGGSIQVEDKLFDDWSLDEELSTPVTNGDGVAMVNPSDIAVTGIGAFPDVGLNFSSNGGLFAQAPNEGDSGAGSAFFKYDVTVVDDKLRIKDSSVNISEFTLEGPSDEDNRAVAANQGNTSIYSVAAISRVLDGVQDEDLFDKATFSPITSFRVSANAAIAANNLSGTGTVTAELQEFQHRFSQIRVPEPGTVGMFGLGLASIGFAVRRRRQD